GNTFKVIRQGLERNGYYLKWAVLNATEYGNMPQNRERIYIVGFRSQEAFRRFKFPEKMELTTRLDDLIDFVNAVDYKYYYSKGKNPTFYDKLEEAITSQNTVYQWRRQYVRENKSGVVPTLTANMGTGGDAASLMLATLGTRNRTPRQPVKVRGFPVAYSHPDAADSSVDQRPGNRAVVPGVQRIAKGIELASGDRSSNKEEALKEYAL